MNSRPLLKRFAPLLSIILAACATPPAQSPEGAIPAVPAPPPAPFSAPVEAVVAAADSAHDATAAAPEPVEPLEALAVAEAPVGLPTPAVLAPVGDLFDRLRAGYQLEDVDQTAVRRELNWYANNPEYLDRVFNRAGLYLHYIVGQLEQRGMPRELALLPVVESAFEPYAYSRARAAGLWQFIPGTGSMYGLKQDWWYEGRRDVVEATRAALDYLQKLHDDFDGDWLLAVAAYNCGEANVARAIRNNRRVGKRTDFWHLKLPAETRAYVPKLMAMSRLVANPGDYGLEFSYIPDEPYFVEVATGGQINLQVVAELANITKEEIYELNSAYHRWATDPAGPHKLLVPIANARGLQDALLSLTPEQRLNVQPYVVQAGDTLASLAQRSGVSPQDLRQLNGLPETAVLTAGASVQVPARDIVLPAKVVRAAALADRRGTRSIGGVHVVRRGDTLSSIARRNGTNAGALARLNGISVNDTIRAGQRLMVSASARSTSSTAARTASARTVASGDARRVSYTVRRGDTLSSIARVLQVTLSDLMNWNGMSRNSVIKPGQKLVAFVRSRAG